MSSARLRFGSFGPPGGGASESGWGPAATRPPTEAFPWRTGHGRVAVIIDVTRARHHILPITED